MKQTTITSSQPTFAVLVVDDDFFMQRIAIKMLTSLGHTGVVVDGGRQALDCLSKRKFDAVLLDVTMPDMDGLQTLSCIRENDIHSGWRQTVIMMTGHDEPGDVQKLKQAGADGYIGKPIDVVQMQTELVRVISAAK